ncbi:MAG: helix-turn-helix domain-containing protein [Thermomicrobiales bacterium]|nr:helix-turn-helix domain-containing protein [Thermomicrobiales bacterium]
MPRGRTVRRNADTNGTATPEPVGGRWLTIHEACAFLGVDQSTLRRWSDSGKVPVFRTPGGHRRYAEADLRSLVGDGPQLQERPRVSRQAITDRSLSGYEDDYLRVMRERPWFRAYGGASQEEHRRLGRRLVDLAVRYAASPATAADRTALLDEALQIGTHYGRSGANLGLAASETVEAFIYFRFPVVQAVSALIEEQGLATRRAIRLYAEINQFLDQVLVATVQAHQATGSSPKPPVEPPANAGEGLARSDMA